MNQKERLSASVDSELISAAERAVKSGRSPSVSAWVNDALRLKLDQERRLEALSTFVASYEAEHGEITHEEMRRATRRARASAVTVRSMPREEKSRARKRR